MMVMRRHVGCARLVPAALVCLAMGCGVERGVSTFPAQEIGADMGEPDMSADMDGLALGAGRGPGEMTGTWLLVNENSTCLLRQEQVSVTEYLVDIRQEGQTLVETRRVCNISLSPVLGVPIKIPDATRESIVFPQVDRGRVSGLRAGSGYSSATEVGLWGLEMDDPLLDEVPTVASDAMVRDADGDGEPGVTFDVGVGDGCARYASQRQVVNYQGTFTSQNLIEGSSVTLVEAAVFGATSSTCATAPSMQPNDAFSRFRMARVDGRGAFDADADGDGVVSCAEVAGLGVQLIPSREPDAANCR